MDYNYDFVFIGGGILGSAASWALAEKEKGARIAVVDLDLDGEFSSTLANAGGVRPTWRNRANIELCNYSIDFYRTIAKEIQFDECGYFWMHDEASWREVKQNSILYREYGIPFELHKPEDVPDIGNR